MIHPIKAFNARIVFPWMSSRFDRTKYGRILRSLKDVHKGERCFIVANGPSLRAEDLDRLQAAGEITFAMNRIYKIFPQTSWRPTYYACEDINIFHESQDAINALPAKLKFIPINHKWYNGVDIDGAVYFYANYDRAKDFPNSFSPAIDKQMDSMGTSPSPA